MTTTTSLEPITLRDAITLLRSGGMNVEDISAALGDRVTPRTIYRWGVGETGPQSASLLVLVKKLVEDKLQRRLDFELRVGRSSKVGAPSE